MSQEGYTPASTEQSLSTENESSSKRKPVQWPDEILNDPLATRFDPDGNYLYCLACSSATGTFDGRITLRRTLKFCRWYAHCKETNKRHANAVANMKAEAENKDLKVKKQKMRGNFFLPKKKKTNVGVTKSNNSKYSEKKVAATPKRNNACCGIFNSFKGDKKNEVNTYATFIKPPPKLQIGTYRGVPSLKSAECTGEGTFKAIDGGMQCKACYDVRRARGSSNPGVLLNKWYCKVNRGLERRYKSTLSTIDLQEAKQFAAVHPNYLLPAGIDLRNEAIAQADYGKHLSKISPKLEDKDKTYNVEGEVAVPSPTSWHRRIRRTPPPKRAHNLEPTNNKKTIIKRAHNKKTLAMDTKKKENVVIIGSGPAAHTAAIYLARADLNPLMFEGALAAGVAAGGQLTTTVDVENFPGFPDGVSGFGLTDNFRKQSVRFGTRIVTETVANVNFSSRPFQIKSESGKRVFADAVVVATGATARRLQIPGTREGEYWQRGVSACAVCDGAAPIYRRAVLSVIGGGDSAMEEAIFLTKYASKVIIIHRREELRASKIMQRRALNNPKIEFLLSHVVEEAKGDGNLLRSIVVRDLKSGKTSGLNVGGLFFAIGHEPNVSFLSNQLELDEQNYITTKPDSTATSVEGVFAAGDVQDKKWRQAITAAGTGCMAALEVEAYLEELHDGEDLEQNDSKQINTTFEAKHRVTTPSSKSRDGDDTFPAAEFWSSSER